MTLSFPARALSGAALLSLVSLAQAQSAPPVTTTTTTTTTASMAVSSNAAIAAMPAGRSDPMEVKPKPCPFPTGSHIRPVRGPDGICPGVDETELDTMNGQTTSGGIIDQRR